MAHNYLLVPVFVNLFETAFLKRQYEISRIL